MNFELSQMPSRSTKPRENGLTMVMDKGLSLRETEDFISSSGEFTDIVKLGFGSSLITPNLDKKIALYKEAGIPVYFGGTLLEAFLIRDEFDTYLKVLSKYKMEYAEISDGSIVIPHKIKCDYIKKLAKHVTVISEVGSKEEGIIIRPNVWIQMMERELEAGVWKVIAEARESGTVGIYRPNGKAHVMLINKIISRVPADKIIWETPQKSQQVYFIKQFGTNVNLGNIAPNEVIALESLRLGLRSDTFFHFLDKETINKFTN
ncbi:MAG: phosphosulfolactate synthase [Bacteroidetes bacterium]|nr:phosphosulfolactate synthase [Bacteroidota bacterium]MBX7238098.1 phosphosulfolactate synthase [Bacteroidia bacterium]MCC7513966.1 phosphosulfolactate synthase [Bacteroidia bacterium]MCW5919238.1 phosphosulfolactate synthase [Bacteroidota bacterium]HMU76544.1 phosphosulfolactate synthase [Bacteroidia bacterium]